MNEVTFQREPGILNGNGLNVANPTKKAEHSDSFVNMLERSMKDVNQLKLKADDAVENLAAGKEKDIHATMIALEKADVAFQLLMQVRNKIISAYETVMRTQV